MKNLIISMLVIFCTTNTFSQNIAYCNDGPLRIRSSPSINGEIVGAIETYEKVKIYEHSENREKIGDSEAYWYKVETKGEVQGWTFGAFLDIYDGTATVVFGDSFSIEFPANTRVRQKSNWVVQDGREYVFRQGFAVHYLEAEIHLEIYYIHQNDITLSEIKEKYDPEIIEGNPGVGLGDSFSYLKDNRLELLTGDGVTKISVLLTNWASFRTTNAAFVYCPSKENHLFSGIYLEFFNLWKDPKDQEKAR